MANEKNMAEEVVEENQTVKRFSYKLGEVNLAFQLGIDSPERLQKFTVLLARAQADVAAELEKFNQ